MTAALILLLSSAAADRCLPGDEGFLSMRLRGSIETEIRWRAPELDCTGMSRPDGRGLRLRFAGTRDGGGELAVVFAAPALDMGVSARGVPVNVTLLDGASERIYGTQGDGRCQFDEVEQKLLADAALPPRSYRVDARGFCTVPARAVDGDGAVLLTRFDFAGLVTYDEDDGAPVTGPAPSPFPALATAELQLMTASGPHDFRVWIADDDRSRARGLMFVRELAPDQGMLFLFDGADYRAFWMKDTYLALDLVFIAEDGKVVNVARDATPLSLEPIPSKAPVKAVLEILAGTAGRIGLQPGDRIRHPAFGDGR